MKQDHAKKYIYFTLFVSVPFSTSIAMLLLFDINFGRACIVSSSINLVETKELQSCCFLK